MIAVHPEYTIDDICKGHFIDPSGRSDADSILFAQKVVKHEMSTQSKIRELRLLMTRTIHPRSRPGMMRYVNEREVWVNGQISTELPAQVYEPPYTMQGENLKSLREYTSTSAIAFILRCAVC